MSERYRLDFVKIFWQCMAEGMTTVEAREYAALELKASEKERNKDT